MLGEIRGEVRFKEPLAFHTSLRCGGPADIFIIPQDVDDVRKTLMFADKEKLPIAILGSGHNTIVRDRGYRGIVLKIEGCLGRMEFHGEEVTIGCGAGLSTMIREAAALGLGGIECLVGIPATLGGALAMNAGTHDGAIWDFVSAVYFLHPDGTIGELKPAPGVSMYRTFALPTGAILLGVRLQLHRKPQKEILAEIRGATQAEEGHAAARARGGGRCLEEPRLRPGREAAREDRAPGQARGRRRDLREARQLHHQSRRRHRAGRHRSPGARVRARPQPDGDPAHVGAPSPGRLSRAPTVPTR